jgi:hypothetical protein
MDEPTKSPKRRGRSGMTMEELLAGMTPEACREAAAEVDWGPDVGRERVEEWDKWDPADLPPLPSAKAEDASRK